MRLIDIRANVYRRNLMLKPLGVIMELRTLVAQDIPSIWQINYEGLPGTGDVTEKEIADLMLISERLIFQYFVQHLFTNLSTSHVFANRFNGNMDARIVFSTFWGGFTSLCLTRVNNFCVGHRLLILNPN